jgi:hypothetical protein
MSRRMLEIAAFCAALLIAALVFHAWLSAHDDQLRLAATLASQKQILNAADARERDRNATLKDALAQIDALKRQAQSQTPAQIARALQEALQLPQPITMVPNTAQNSSVGTLHAVSSVANTAPTPLASFVDRESSASPSATDARSTQSTAIGSQQGTVVSPQQGPDGAPRQGTGARAKSLLGALFHRSPPRTSADATSVPEPLRTFHRPRLLAHLAKFPPPRPLRRRPL